MKRLSGILLTLYFRFPGVRLFLLMILIFIVFSITTVVLFQSEDVRTDPQGWEKPRQVSARGIASKNPAAESRGNLIAVVYEGDIKGMSGIYVSVSVNGGAEFIPPVKIAEYQTSINKNPGIAISRGGEIYVVWNILSEDEANGSIFFSKSADLGATWSAPERITFGMQMEILPVLAFDERDKLHLFYTAYRDKIFNLFHSVQEEGKFAEPEPVAKLKGNIKGAFFPAVKFYKNSAAVVWQTKEESYIDHLYFVKSEDYGDSWSGVENITTGKSNNQAPSIEIYDDIIYLVYMNNSEKNWAINMLRGYRLGDRWDEVPLKVSETNANCYSPDITIGPDNELFITWHDLREKGSRIFYREYSTKNREFLAENKLSAKQSPGRNSVAIGSGKRLLVFWDEAGTITMNQSDIYVSSPVVASRSHPEDGWSRDTAAVITWSKPFDESGIAGYATLIDKNPDTNPTIQNQRYDASSTLITGLEDGITYFHIRTIDGAGNMSRTVHYRLQVSSNPLAMPVIVSTTHPENGNASATDAVLRWAVNDTRRLKGFVYSFTKDTPVKPGKFLDDFEIKFSSLEEGIYFFNLASVSKTNQVSRVSTYTFIVGKEGKVDPEYLKNIANLDLDEERERPASAKIPGIELVFPFGTLSSFNKGSFEGIIKPVNITPENIEGYSVIITRETRVPPERINLKSGIINIAGLTNGDYTVGARCRFFKIINGKRTYFWTEPVYRSFSIVLPPEFSPFDYLYASLKKRIGRYPVAIAIALVSVFSAVTYRGYRGRIRFFVKSVDYRLRTYF